ncbi:MAG: DPP IV N-terminal domain-containing protein [Vicinamibacterales bacterium]
MKQIVYALLTAVLTFTVVPLGARQAGPAPQDREPPAANYDLAARWTSAKVAKYVFSTSVAPHWLEFSDRFWYSYETPAGERWWLVDPVKKTKAPLWDNATMAAQLTRILRTPYDAQHLPINTIEFIDQDTKIRFSVRLPRDSKVVNAAGEELLGETQQQENQVQGGGQRGRGGRGGGQGQGAGRGGANANTAEWWLEYDLATGTVTLNDTYKPEKDNPSWAQVSPDKKTVVFARGHNLFMMDADNFAKAKEKEDDPAVVETQLTTDGEQYYGYAANSGRGGGDDDQQDEQENTQGGRGGRGGAGRQQYVETEQDKKFGRRTRAVGVSWSQDDAKFALTRNDSRKVEDLWVINALANPRPRLETYKYGMPGEENQPQTELQVFDLASKQAVKVNTDAFKDQQMGLATAPITNLQREKRETASRWLAVSGDAIYYNRTSRDLKRIDIVRASTATGESTVVIPERSNTYIEIQPLRLIAGGKQLIHWSERDGWGHYYLYNADGTLVRQITSGEYVCTGIEGFDDATRTLYFTAAGREAGEDPYFEHLYKVNVDTGEMKLLTPGNGSHNPSMNDKATFFVDTSSRVDSAPVSVLYDVAGNKVMDLEQTDVSALLEAGFRYPEPFAVKADDGVTDIYGTMYKPFDFDPAKSYPIILYVYPGPQTESVTKTFSPRNANVALANTGFIVIEVGNRGGNPARSKWYHNYGYGNLRDYGVPDKKAAVEQLAKRYPWIDLNRVGIYGHSGGGFMTAAAMFGYPDFFKVGISESGNHDNSIYNRWWSEKHDGVKEVTDEDGKVTFEYDIDKNQDIAKNLKGHLLLITGDIDNNVHPSNTYRVIDALIKANKRFDFILLPGQRHGYGAEQNYVFWRRVDYFAQHLLGMPPLGVDIVELTREQQIKR